MKLKILTLATLLCSLTSFSQSKALKTIETGATNKVVEATNNTVSQTVDKIFSGSIFKRKAAKTNNDASTAPAEQPVAKDNGQDGTELTIPNIDYSSIVALADVIKSNKSVTDVQRSFNNGSAVINVTHACKTEELLDDILKNTSGKYDVAAVSKGKITLKTKN